MISDDESFPVTPKGFESTVPMAAVTIKEIQARCSGSRRRGLLVGCHSLPASLNCCVPRAKGVICDLLLVSGDLGLHLFTLCRSDTEDPGQLARYSHAAAQALKRSLALRGNCKEKFYVSYQVVHCTAELSADLFEGIGDNRYPASYVMKSTLQKFRNTLDALVIVFASIPSPLSTKLGVTFLHLLTKDQFQLVQQKINDHREFWVQGAAGTGKSVVAVEFMRELLHRDPHLKKEEILYVCRSRGMRFHVR